MPIFIVFPIPKAPVLDSEHVQLDHTPADLFRGIPHISLVVVEGNRTKTFAGVNPSNCQPLRMYIWFFNLCFHTNPSPSSSYRSSICMSSTSSFLIACHITSLHPPWSISLPSKPLWESPELAEGFTAREEGIVRVQGQRNTWWLSPPKEETNTRFFTRGIGTM